MKVQTYLKAGEFVAVGTASSGNGHAPAAAANGSTTWSPDELLNLLGHELQPWFTFPNDAARGLAASKQEAASSRSFIVADRAMQGFVQKWIDPLMGEKGEQHLQKMGLAVDTSAVSPQERVINRHLVIGLVTTLATIGGLTILPPLLGLATIGILYSTLITAHTAYQAFVQKRNLTAAFTATLSTVGAWFGGYFLACAIGLVLYSSSEKLLFASQNRTRQNLVTLYNQQPRTAWLLIGGQEIEVPFAQVQVGDIVVTHAGQTIPVDGTIVYGIAMIDQHTLTGEAQPVERSIGAPVLATTVVLTGSIHIRVEKAGQNTAAAEISRIFTRMDSHQLSVQAKAVEFADRAVLPAMLLSGAALPFIGTSAAVALLRLPLALTIRFTAPVAMLSYLNVLSRRGILVKDGRSLELLADIDTVVFDKTGTLTMEEPHVSEIYALDSLNTDEILELAAIAEQHQSHPIARAILTSAQAHGVRLRSLDDAQYKVGLGIEVRVAGQVIQVGSGRFMRMQGIQMSEAVDALQQRCSAQGHSLVFVAVDGRIAGAIELRATIRPETKKLIQDLHARGLQVHILSGDQEAPTQHLAQELGIDHYSANVLPEAKGAVIEQLQSAGRSVCFVGDGINDGIALKKAHVSVSLRGATTVAIDAAQIVLLEENLDHFIPLLEIAADLDSTQRRSFSIAWCLRGALLGGVVLLGLGVWWSVAIMTTSSVLGLINGTVPVRKFKTVADDSNKTPKPNQKFES